MSKKKFKKGLDILFDVPQVTEAEETVFFEKTPLTKKQRPKKTSVKSSSRKNFTSDIDALLNEAMESEANDKRKVEKEKKKRTTRLRPVKGLNALIRQTLDPEFYEIEDNKKRVSFIYDKKQYQRLKEIAKNQNAYLKDIIGQILNRYIERYDH